MSLSEAVLEIADEMSGFEGDPTRAVLALYGQQLRRVVKAAGPDPALLGIPAVFPDLHRIEMQAKQAKEEIEARSKRRNEEEEDRAARQAERGAGMVELAGGPDAGALVEIAGMPVNAYTMVAGHAYQLMADGKLHFSEEQTARARGVP